MTDSCKSKQVKEAEYFHMHKYDIRTGPAALRTMERVFDEYDVGNLALMGEQYPYIIPMNHYYKDGKFYWHTAFVGKKHLLLKRNPKACYLVDMPVKPYDRGERYFHNPWLSIICYGVVDEMEDPEEKLPILQAYSKRQLGPPVKLERAKTTNVMRFTIEKATGRYGRYTPAERRSLLYWDFTKTVTDENKHLLYWDYEDILSF